MKYVFIFFCTAFCLNTMAQETLQTVTDRGNSTTNSIQLGGGTVNANTTKLLINNPAGKNWAVSAGANMITEMGLHIYNWSDNPNMPLLSVLNDGRVGIGIFAPVEKLSVNGNIRAKEIKVETANWPDYVFNPAYRLMPLDKIEDFVKQNGHLPEVPSAKEVSEKGVEVGANQSVLLKKIEELTLHLIEMKKDQATQEEKIAQQEKKAIQQEKINRSLLLEIKKLKTRK